MALGFVSVAVPQTSIFVDQWRVVYIWCSAVFYLKLRQYALIYYNDLEFFNKSGPIRLAPGDPKTWNTIFGVCTCLDFMLSYLEFYTLYLRYYSPHQYLFLAQLGKNWGLWALKRKKSFHAGFRLEFWNQSLQV